MNETANKKTINNEVRLHYQTYQSIISKQLKNTIPIQVKKESETTGVPLIEGMQELKIRFSHEDVNPKSENGQTEAKLLPI